MKEFIESIIQTGNYVLSEMEERIQKMYVLGKLTEADMTYLLNLAAENARDSYQIDVVAKLAELEERIARIESAGVVVWTSGHTTNRGETVMYDILKDGNMRYCRYDGGRAYTALSPGKIDGWVVLASIGGEVTHRIERDENGKIVLVPVEEE
jgi:hypothetical protein